jgi:hypothetical protein
MREDELDLLHAPMTSEAPPLAPTTAGGVKQTTSLQDESLVPDDPSPHGSGQPHGTSGQPHTHAHGSSWQTASPAWWWTSLLRCLPPAWSMAVADAPRSVGAAPIGHQLAAAPREQAVLAEEVQRLFPTVRAMAELQGLLLERLDGLALRMDAMDDQIVEWHRSGGAKQQQHGLFSHRMRVSALLTATSKRSYVTWTPSSAADPRPDAYALPAQQQQLMRDPLHHPGKPVPVPGVLNPRALELSC